MQVPGLDLGNNPITQFLSNPQTYTGWLGVFIFIGIAAAIGFFVWADRKYPKIKFLVFAYDAFGLRSYTRQPRLIGDVFTTRSLFDIFMRKDLSTSIPITKFDKLPFNGIDHYIGINFYGTVLPFKIDELPKELQLQIKDNGITLPLGFSPPKMSMKDIGAIQDITRINVEASEQVQELVNANAPLIMQIISIAGVLAVGFACMMPVIGLGVFAMDKINTNMEIQKATAEAFANIPTDIRVTMEQSGVCSVVSEKYPNVTCTSNGTTTSILPITNVKGTTK